MKYETRIKRLVIGIGIAAVIVAGAAFTVGRPATPQVAVALAAEAAEIVAEGLVVPRQQVNLAFGTSGLAVAEVLVKKGELVKAGQILATVDDRALVLQVEQAQAQVDQAQAGYDALIARATPEEIAQNEAQIAQAEAQRTQARGGVTPQDVAAAKAQVEQARATVVVLERGPKTAEIERAQAGVARAEATLQSQRDALSAAKTNAELATRQAADALVQAQSRHAAAQRNREHVQATGNDPTTGRGLDDIQKAAFVDAETQALAAMQSAERSVEQANVAFEAARQAEINGIAGAEAALRDARAALDVLLAGAGADQRAAARAQLAQAQANLARLDGEQRTGALAAGDAAVASARASYDLLLATPATAELARATAQVKQAQVAVKSAELALENAAIRAPIDGSVAEINLTVGETPDPQQAAMVLASDTWQIETTDLTELQVVDLEPGGAVEIAFDALPDLVLRGTITEIATIGERKQGDITYTVVITPEQSDPRLRWNMTAAVRFPGG